MDFIDLGKQYKRIQKNVDDAIKKVIDSRHFIMGNEVIELENILAKYVGRKYCLTCGSGTEALQIPLMAFGLNKNDAIFVPSFTFFATAESVSLAGGTPVFVDIDETYNIDCESLEREINRINREGKLTPRGIIPVDLFGRSANYDKIIPIAHKFNLFILEDSAQGFGGSLHGKKNCSFGEVSATSFFPAKPLGCYGDGGAIFTDDDDLYNKMKSIRVHGEGLDRYDNVCIGINGRLDTIQAAILIEKIKIFDDELIKRNEIANLYNNELRETFIIPKIEEDYFSSWAQYTLRAQNENERTQIIEKMKKINIPVMVYYPIPLHMQTAYKSMGVKQDNLNNCLCFSKEVFSLPMHPYLEKDEVINITTSLKKIINEIRL